MDGYNVLCQGLEEYSRRGLLVYIASSINASVVEVPDKFQECLFLMLKLSHSDSSKNLLIGNIYRSPSSTLENYNRLYDLLDYIEQHFSVPKLVVGDYNYSKINWYQVSGFGVCAQCLSLNDNEMAFVNVLRENSLLQQVVNPTRQRGTDTPHILAVL